MRWNLGLRKKDRRLQLAIAVRQIVGAVVLVYQPP